MDKTAGVCKEQRENFILLVVLPHLEESWGKCSSSNEEVYKILAKISCSINSGKVVRHALQQLFHLICKDNFGSGNGNLLVVEATIRSSIFSSEGMFKKDEHSEKNLKLFVYSRILSLLLMQQVLEKELPIAALEQDLKMVQEELKRLKNRKRDAFRYSMECIQITISHLLKPRDKLRLLGECQMFCANPTVESKDLKFLRKLAEKNKSFQMNKRVEWIDLHCILVYLHGKVGQTNDSGCLYLYRANR